MIRTIYITGLVLLFTNGYAQYVPDMLPQLRAKYYTQRVGQGEYQCLFSDPATNLPWGTGNISNIGIGGSGTQGIVYRTVTSPSNLTTTFVAGGLHGAGFIGSDGYVRIMGEMQFYNGGTGVNTDTLYPRKILIDSAGNDFDSCVYLAAYFFKISGGGSLAGYNGWYCIRVVNGEYKLFGWGMMLGGLRGNGTNNIAADSAVKRPVEIPLPAGKQALKIVVGYPALLLTTDGNVYTMGQTVNANLGYTMTGMQYASFRHLSTMSNIKDIGVGKNFQFALTASGDTLYGWGSWGNYMGDGTFPSAGGAAIPTPTRLTNITNNLPGSIDRIWCNDVSTHVILEDSTLWGWGGNSEGTIGIGTERAWSSYACAQKYAWDNTLAAAEKVRFPVQVMKGKKFVNLYGSAVYTFYRYAEDSEGQLYAWGRNKGSVITDGIRGANSTLIAQKQSSWDRYWPVPVNPFTQNTSYAATSPACVIDGCTGSPCNTYTVPANTAPNANAGVDQSVSTTTANLDATNSTDNVFIQRYVWRALTSPGGSAAYIDVAGGPTPTVHNMTDGTYTFELTVTDNGWLSDKDTVQIVVNTSVNLPPNCDAGTDQTVTLPTASVNLSASDSDPDGTISSRLWTIESAPIGSTANFSNNAISNPSFSTMIEGNYTLKYLVTDNLAATCSSLVNITVNAAPVNQPPVADAGSPQSIQQPTHVVTVTGDASTDPDGTIVSWLWEQIDSNDPVNILNPTSETTDINFGTKSGFYVFQLTVTDNNGSTDQATVVIQVFPRWAFNSNGKRLRFAPRN